MVHRSDIFYANGKGIGLVRGRLFEKNINNNNNGSNGTTAKNNNFNTSMGYTSHAAMIRNPTKRSLPNTSPNDLTETQLTSVFG